MTKIELKLQSKRGASIMLALLLLLVCLLAGIASLTAASANVGRHSYMRETQQQYLAVSSAARLIREQLDGMEIKCEYRFEVPEDGEEHYLPPQPDSASFAIVNAKFTNGTNAPKYYSNDAEIDVLDNELIKFFADALKTMNFEEFYQKVNSSGDIVPWTDCVSYDSTAIDNIQKEYSFTVTCDEIKITDETDGTEKPLSVDVKVTLDYSGTNKSINVVVSYKDYAVSIGGTIVVDASNPDNDIFYDVYDSINPDGSIVSGMYAKVRSSVQNTSIKFVIDDAFTLPDKGDTP